MSMSNPQEDQFDDQEVTCYRCGWKGHFSKCPKIVLGEYICPECHRSCSFLVEWIPVESRNEAALKRLVEND